MRFIHEKNSTIRQALKHLANAKWPKMRLLGFLPIRSYRLRQEANSPDFIWWIERDISAYDRYRCEAYAVKLSINGRGETILNVYSGTNVYPVNEPILFNLTNALEKAAHDPAMVIPRRMGAAHY